MWRNRSQQDEREIERLLKAAQETPVEPMSETRIGEVLRHVVVRQQECAPFPAGPFVFMAVCLLVVGASLLLAAGGLPAARAVVVLLLVSNVGLSPLTAIAIAWTRRRQYEG
ncbi:MAG: hypothetical protein ABSH05_05905 [Bryobacteraceae bacterium]